MLDSHRHPVIRANLAIDDPWKVDDAGWADGPDAGVRRFFVAGVGIGNT